MAEILRGMDTRTAQPVEFRDTEPLESARLFRSLSDAILDQRRSQELNFHEIPTWLEVGETARVANQAVSGIDQRFEVTQKENGLYLIKEPKMRVGRELGRLVGVSLYVESMDDEHDRRYVEVNGEDYNVQFTDGHRDYCRKLALKLGYQKDNEFMTLSYNVQRHQATQQNTTQLFSILWTSTTQKERVLTARDVTGNQESEFLRACQVIGALSSCEK